jgi:alpha-beta hydrolase superfamily lysophospholipase
MRPVTSATTMVSARDGTAILVRRWSAVTPPWAHVVLVHGIAEHSGRYEDVGEWLAAAGLGVSGYDQRGFGSSGGRRAWIDRWSRNHDDLEARIREARAIAGDRPLVVYGHSLGGLLALGYAVADEPRPLPDALVLSAPGLDSSVPAWKRAVARVLDRVAPTVSLSNDFDGAVLSRDPTVGERYLLDPLNEHRTTVHFGALAFAEQARVRAAVGRLSIPTLVYHGEADELVPPWATEPLAAVPAVTRRTYPQLRHESHNEPEGHEVIDDVVAWLHATVGDWGPVLESGDN